MWYAFWAVTLAFISLAIIWYAMYRENLEGTGAAKGDPIRSSLKFLDSATPAAPPHASATPKKSTASESPTKTSNPPQSISKTSPKKGPKK